MSNKVRFEAAVTRRGPRDRMPAAHTLFFGDQTLFYRLCPATRRGVPLSRIHGKKRRHGA
jgi:hypothetical protein